MAALNHLGHQSPIESGNDHLSSNLSPRFKESERGPALQPRARAKACDHCRSMKVCLLRLLYVPANYEPKG